MPCYSVITMSLKLTNEVAVRGLIYLGFTQDKLDTTAFYSKGLTCTATVENNTVVFGAGSKQDIPTMEAIKRASTMSLLEQTARKQGWKFKKMSDTRVKITR